MTGQVLLLCHVPEWNNLYLSSCEVVKAANFPEKEAGPQRDGVLAFRRLSCIVELSKLFLRSSSKVESFCPLTHKHSSLESRRHGAKEARGLKPGSCLID